MPSRPPRHRNASVAVAYVRPSYIPGQFCDDLSGLLLYDRANQGYVSGTIAMRSSPRIAEARSQVVEQFMKPDSPVTGDWLLWLDADATFPADVLARLMDHAHEQDVPVLGALAFGGSSPDNMFPTVYGLTPTDDGNWDMDKVVDYPRDALVKVGATGCHCVLVHRSVFWKMYQAYKAKPDGSSNPYPWYAEGVVDSRGRPFGEDTVFAIRAQMIDIPIHVHTGVKTGHVKEIVLDEALWDSKVRDAPRPELKLA